jgi:hypothetical protein
MNSNQDSNQIANIISAKLLKYELLILIILLVAILLRYFRLPASGIICTIILSSIAILYFVSTFTAPENKEIKPFDLMVKKLIGLSSSICVIGILFILQKWPGSNSMLQVGPLTLLLCLVYIIFNKENTIFNKYQIIRLLFLIVLSTFFYYINYHY